jgi:multiple sugar transport system permease protein
MSASTSTRRAGRSAFRLTRSRVVAHAWAFVFVGLALTGLIVLTIGPIVASFLLSFTDWDLLGAPRFIGLRNFEELFADTTFWRAVQNTIVFTTLSVPLGMALSLGLAMALNRKLRGIGFYRTLFLLPLVASSVATALIWGLMLDPVAGPVNYLLGQAGLPQPGWLGDTFWAMPSIIIMSIWKGFGLNVVIFLAGLQGIPNELYEAAQIDGAGRFARFRHITLPMLSPTTFFVLLIALIASFQVFDSTYVLTKGGPQDSTITLVYYVYQTGFQQLRMGYASAISYVLFAMTLVIVGIQWLSQRRWVHYE